MTAHGAPSETYNVLQTSISAVESQLSFIFLQIKQSKYSLCITSEVNCGLKGQNGNEECRPKADTGEHKPL